MNAAAAGSAPADGAWPVLALNSGSSSLKFGLFGVRGEHTVCLLAGADDDVPAPCPQGAVARIARLLARSGLPPPQAIGHRVVHGGPALRSHARIDAALLAQLAAASAFAPLHTPAALALIGCAQRQFPGLPQVACFDTSFHAAMPDVARVLPLPRALRAEGLQRYGFHGLSCESIVHQLTGALPRRLLIAHLGNGASVTAVQNGVSIDTSMGLTPTGGLIMGTRSGDLDPGVLLHLMREKRLDGPALEDLLDRRSGLTGISGIGSDMRALHHAAGHSADARLAIRMFCCAAAKALAAMGTALGGVDVIVFTGGIGENDAAVRADICGRLAWLVSAGSPCSVRVLPSQEDEQIARHTWALCQPAPTHAPRTTQLRSDAP